MPLSTDHPAPWNIYAEELFHLGYGHPLWTPDPEKSEWEVEIADVGYLEDGEFIHLVRTRSSLEAEYQPHGLLPDNHVPFDPLKSTVRGPREKITQSVLHSRTIKKIDLNFDASVKDLPAAVGGNIGLHCAKDKGALLALSPNGEETSITAKRRIVNYISKHLDSWVRLANSESLGIGLDREEILFVSSVIKTHRWGVAAFYGSQKGAQASISLDAGGFVSGGITIDFSNVYTPGVTHKTGPPHPRREDEVNSLTLSSAAASAGLYDCPSQSILGTGSSVSLVSAATDPDPRTRVLTRESFKSSSSFPILKTTEALRDTPGKATQCIFFHYYKAKRRVPFLGLRLKARAGYHELPPSQDHECSSSGVLAKDGSSHRGPEMDFEVVSSKSKPYDPVNTALDYILENSEAEMAIASDLDLYALFKDQNFPSDVAEQLARLRPQVEVDDSGVGTLAVNVLQSQNMRAGDGSREISSVQCAAFASDAPQRDDGDSSDSEVYALRSGKRLDYHAKQSSPKAAGETSVLDFEETRSTETDMESITDWTCCTGDEYPENDDEAAYLALRYKLENTAVHSLQAHDDAVSALAFSPTGDLLASASNRGQIKLWAMNALYEEPRTVNVTGSICSLAFIPTGSNHLDGSTDGTLPVSDASGGALFGTTKYDDDVTFIVSTADGRLMATGGAERTCYVWDVANLATGKPKVVLSTPDGMITSASFLFDGQRIVTGSSDCSCHIWRMEDGMELATLLGHSGSVRSVCYSPDGKRVVSGSNDSIVKVWDALTGECLLSLEEHDGAVHKVAYSPDGVYIASASSDDTICLWSAEEGECVSTYSGHVDLITSLEFSPDGETLAAGADDGAVHIISLSVGA